MKVYSDLNLALKTGKRLIKYQENDKAIDERRFKIAVLIGFIGAILILIAGCELGHASTHEIPKERAIMAIIGEAENQGLEGMTAVGCALRNRGTLKGVYGENAPRVRGKRFSLKTYRQAEKAWEASANKDITNGATMWENIKAFGVPYWAKSCKETVTIKNHKFFKC